MESGKSTMIESIIKKHLVWKIISLQNHIRH